MAAAVAAVMAAAGDEESERDSVQTGESREEAQQDLAKLSLPQLHSLVDEISHDYVKLKLETTMFEKFFNRIEPRDAADKHGSSLDLGPAQFLRGRRKSRARITADRLVCLTVEQKCDIAQRELEETREDIKRVKESSERILQNYLAMMEEADIRMADIKKAVADFDREIIKTITKKKGSVIASDKVLRYMEDKIRARDVLKEKIRLKNDSLKVQKKKMQMQLKQKEELGEALHEVDFQQLKIENAQFLEKIDERNQELLQLKVTVGSALQVLNFYRERGTAEVLNKKLRRQLAIYKVPPVLNYVHEKMAIHELESIVKIWERKVEIAEMALQSYRSLWHKAKVASQQLQAMIPEQGSH